MTGLPASLFIAFLPFGFGVQIGAPVIISHDLER